MSKMCQSLEASEAFQCRNGGCIPSDWRMDEENDCEDNSDEGHELFRGIEVMKNEFSPFQIPPTPTNATWMSTNVTAKPSAATSLTVLIIAPASEVSKATDFIARERHLPPPPLNHHKFTVPRSPPTKIIFQQRQQSRLLSSPERRWPSF